MLISRGKRKAKTDKGGGVTRSVIMPVFIMGVALILSAAAASLVAMPGTGTRAYTAVGEKQISDRYGVVSSDMGIASSPDVVNDELDRIDAAGVEWLRTQFAWSDMEATQGTWDYEGHDLVVNGAQSRGIKVLGILISAPGWANAAGSNPAPFTLYPPTPGDPDDQAAWLNYVEEVCTRYQGRVDAWELWNEPDNAYSWGGGPVDPVGYVNLLTITAEKIRQVDPGAKVVMAGVTNPRNPYDNSSLYPDLSFPEESFLYKSLSLLKDSGKARYVDATAFHDNGNASWGTKRDYMNLVYSWLQTLALGNLEVWVTECGLPHSTVSPDVDQAASVSRVLLTYATEDVDRATAVDEYADMVFYYNLKDDPYQSGLLQNTQPLSTYDAYKYYKTLETVLGTAVGDDPAAAVFSSANAQADLKPYCFIRPDGDLAIAVWMESGLYSNDVLTFTVQDPNYGNPFQVDLATGNRTALASPYFSRDAQGRVVVTQLPISHTPVIIELDSLALPHLYSVTPNACDQAAIITINDVSGAGFVSGTTVRLEMDTSVFTATNVTYNSSTNLTCTFDLSTAAVGYYDVVVKNPDNQEARIVDAYGVAPPGAGCGTGTTAAAIMVFGMTMGLISVREVGRRRRGSGRAK